MQHERHEDREEREDTVRELDVRVEALRLEVMRLAAGPVLAAEPGAGEPNGRAGGDDQDEHHGVQQREPAERLGRERDPAQTGERLRAGVHARTVALRQRVPAPSVDARRSAPGRGPRAANSASSASALVARAGRRAGRRRSAGRRRARPAPARRRRRRPARTRGCCACPPSRRLRAPPRARRRAPAGAPRRSDPNAAALAISCACPSRPKPVTSVTAFGVNGRSTSAASRLSVRIQLHRLRGVDEAALRAAEHERRSERLRQVERVARLRAATSARSPSGGTCRRRRARTSAPRRGSCGRRRGSRRRRAPGASAPSKIARTQLRRQLLRERARPRARAAARRPSRRRR